MLNVVNPNGLGIRQDGTASQMWSSITACYSITSTISAVLARLNMDNMKLQEGRDIISHLQTMQTMWKNANNEGAKIDEDTYKMILVSSLPISYTPILSNIVASKTIAEAEVHIIHIIQWKVTVDRMNGIPGNSSATSQNVPSSMTSSSLLA